MTRRTLNASMVLIAAISIVMAGSAAPALAEIIIWDLENPQNNPQVSIADVEEAGGIQVGDKLFSGFVVTTAATQGTVAPGADAITLTGVQVVGNYGLRFNGGWSAGGQEIADTTIKFKVEVVEPWRSELWMIVDNELWMTAFGVSGDGTGGSVSISENVYLQDPYSPDVDPKTNLPIANKFVYYRSDNDNELYDEAFFVPTPEIWVIKDVIANGGDLTTGVAHISEFYQTFSQVQVPEPATMSLLAVGVAGMILRRRRRRK